MTISIGHLTPIASIAAGILILIMPRLLNYIVAIYLIVIGIIGSASSNSARLPAVARRTAQLRGGRRPVLWRCEAVRAGIRAADSAYLVEKPAKTRQ